MAYSRKTLDQKQIVDLREYVNAYAVELSQGKWALVSPEDLGTVKEYNWCAQKTVNGMLYAVTHVRDEKTGKQRRIYMHRLLMSLGNESLVDHTNCNGLDNRRRNLRVASYSSNGANRRRGVNNTSGTKGVSWDSKKKKWHAGIKHNGTSYNLGNYNNKEEAAQAYAQAAEKCFGEYAKAD